MSKAPPLHESLRFCDYESAPRGVPLMGLLPLLKEWMGLFGCSMASADSLSNLNCSPVFSILMITSCLHCHLPSDIAASWRIWKHRASLHSTIPGRHPALIPCYCVFLWPLDAPSFPDQTEASAGRHPRFRAYIVLPDQHH